MKKKTINVLTTSVKDKKITLDFPCYFKNGNSGRFVKLIDEKSGYEVSAFNLTVLQNFIITESVIGDIQMSKKDNAKKQYYRKLNTYFNQLAKDINMKRFIIEHKKYNDFCKWTDNGQYYETSCGECFEIINGTPADNGMIYCPYCGKIISGE